MVESTPQHWNTIYTVTPIEELGWQELNPEPSLQLIERCRLAKDDPILDAGSGTTSLLAALIKQGYQNLQALDFSQTALDRAQAVLGPELSSRICWLNTDLTQPLPHNLPTVTLWHDRAVFHFFTGESDRQVYRDNLLQVLKPGGFLVLAVFAVGGAAQCSGLPVRNYDQGSLVQFFDKHFCLVESMEYTFRMPTGGLRPYIYVRFQRNQL